MSCERRIRQLEIVEAARAFVGVPFHHQGRHRTRGIDCIGLNVLSHRDAGYVIDDCTVYSRQPDPATLFEYIGRNFDAIGYTRKGMPEGLQHLGHEPEALLDLAQPADVLLFQYRRRGPQHVAIADESGGFLHTWSDVGKVVHDPNSPGNPRHAAWKKRLHSVWRVKPERWQPSHSKQPAPL